MLYGVTSATDRQRITDAEGAEATASMVWVSIYREPALSAPELAGRLAMDPQLTTQAVEQLVRDGRVTQDPETGALRAATFSIPVGSERGWESAVYDHFQAVSTAIASKLRHTGPRSAAGDLVGGATLSFDLYSGHPHEERVYALLETIRAQLNQVWNAVRQANEARPVSDEERIKVTFYFGQNVDDVEAARRSLERAGVEQ
jgi:hypothetical protein